MIVTPISAITERDTWVPRLGADLKIAVYGTPKPKGSLKHIGRGRLVEQVAGSKPWRIAVADAARVAMLPDDADATVPLPPFEGPLRVEITSTVAKPKSAPKRRVTWPVTRSSGDVDKHARNVLDALADAEVYGDDSQVLEVTSRKTYPGGHRDALDQPGAVIRIWRIGGAL